MINIILPPPRFSVGPGIGISLQSNFVGPLPTGSSFHVQVSTDSEGLNDIWGIVVPTTSPNAATSVLSLDQPTELSIANTLQAAASVWVQAQLVEGGTNVQVDSGSQPTTWDPTVGLGQQAWLLAQRPTQGGGLTDAQAQQLQDLHVVQFPILNLDGLALTDLTGGIPTDHLTAGLASSLNGVIVRITQIPAELVPIRGDTNYWHQTLAQVSIFRSNDLWLRFPVHTQSRMFLLPGSETASGIASNDLTAWLLNMHLVLTTFPGVLAEVFLMHTP